jgi:hypothetical protein
MLRSRRFYEQVIVGAIVLAALKGLGHRSPAVGEPQVRDMPLYSGLPVRNY